MKGKGGTDPNTDDAELDLMLLFTSVPFFVRVVQKQGKISPGFGLGRDWEGSFFCCTISYLDIFGIFFDREDDWGVKQCDRVARVPGKRKRSKRGIRIALRNTNRSKKRKTALAQNHSGQIIYVDQVHLGVGFKAYHLRCASVNSHPFKCPRTEVQNTLAWPAMKRIRLIAMEINL